MKAMPKDLMRSQGLRDIYGFRLGPAEFVFGPLIL